MSAITLSPIGVVRSPFTDPQTTPKQPRFSPDTEAEIHIDEPWREGLTDLVAFTRIWVLSWLDRPGFDLTMMPLPPWDTKPHGVFAGRSPVRPNSIGMSNVELMSVDRENGVIRIRGIDLLDGTPVLDIKPYAARIDAHPDAGDGWFETAPGRTETWK
ncbi:tRNA (N6-threonylcarbamoyladenosine(37)-N6)-methyltransferase TrmO [bacterium]|nr:tRNA (N6-threonylcarbamoyladenosine(37)-N6)-methyltransferase TrmO [bacterium]